MGVFSLFSPSAPVKRSGYSLPRKKKEKSSLLSPLFSYIQANPETGQIKHEQNRTMKKETRNNASAIQEILEAARNSGARVTGNQIDFGYDCKCELSIDGARIKFDGGEDGGIEYFWTAMEAIQALNLD